MTTVVCKRHATCELNCFHRTPHKHSSKCVTDTWGVCLGECLTLDWAAPLKNTKKRTPKNRKRR